ncbi:uncharacterized protein LOC120842862 [Ixodes scapularis]|uniref:uncharacterized protein LOC120842862 n=1 Tax=Ixodes scapularis TaxID=6945 RepID=UPI001A9F325C|nr:uncharacterized protein LOC120842862 [Ixodes scapularis]
MTAARHPVFSASSRYETRSVMTQTTGFGRNAGTQACIPSRNKKVQTELSGIMPQTSSSSNCGDPEQSSDSEDLGVSGKQPLERDDPTYCPPEDSSVRLERETPSLVKERKFIVFESCLDLLLGKCQVCAAPLIHVDKSVVGLDM